MRDTIHHSEDGMKRAKSIAKPQVQANRPPDLCESDLRALLDHLGRLLAQEYAALLVQPTVTQAKRHPEDIQ
jgi:hypothetical protein